MLLHHWPNWCKISDIKEEDIAWSNAEYAFLKSDVCPNFIKAYFKRAQSHDNARHNNESDSENDNDTGSQEQPELVDLIRPNGNFDEQISSSFVYDDSGVQYDWSKCSYQYPNDFGKK